MRCELCHKRFSGIMRRHNYKNIMNRNHNEPKMEAYDSSQAREEGCGAQCGLVREEQEQSTTDSSATWVKVQIDTLEEEKRF